MAEGQDLHRINKPTGFQEMMEYLAAMNPNLKEGDDKSKEKAAEEFLMDLGEPEKIQKVMEGFEEAYPDAAKAMQAEKDKIEIEANEEGLDEKIMALPLDDTVWCIGDLDDDDVAPKPEPGQDSQLRLVGVIDSEGLVIHMNTKYIVGTPMKEHLFNVACAAMLKPMVGPPRRPRFVMMRNKGAAKNATVDLSKFGILTIDKDDKYSADPLKQKLPVMRECLVCHRPAQMELLRKCSKCKTVLYCGVKCQKKDWIHKKDVHGHKVWCKRMKEYTERTDELAKLPFTFAKETTDVDFSYNAYQQFLEKQGVYAQGYWRRESMRWFKPADKLPAFGELEPMDFPYVLPSESIILGEKPSHPLHNTQPLTQWSDYYTYRGFRLDSPIAILLHWPLTMYYILTTLLPQNYPHADQVIEQPNSFLIHMLGVEKEIEMIPLFKELAYLIPGVSFEIHMIGPDIADTADGKAYDDVDLHVMVHKCAYHEYPGPPPDFIIGFNAGIGAYMPWANTLVTLKELGVPVYFTDYCQYSCECANPPMEHLKLGTATKPMINPFRCPVRKFCEEQLMPWYSNGFIYTLDFNYKSGAGDADR